MKLTKTKLEGVYIVEPQVFGDERGWFMETYSRIKTPEITCDFVQDNQSYSKEKGILRGIHFQNGEHAQAKLVRCVKGAVLDVAVDLRKGSPTYGQWEGVVLTEENKKQFYVPEGFAHGFLVLSDEAIFNYKCTNLYAPQYDSGLLWNDPDVGIEWPLDGIDEIILSEKDKVQKRLKDLEVPFKY